jgi:hypothetical protein
MRLVRVRRRNTSRDVRVFPGAAPSDTIVLRGRNQPRVDVAGASELSAQGQDNSESATRGLSWVFTNRRIHPEPDTPRSANDKITWPPGQPPPATLSSEPSVEPAPSVERRVTPPAEAPALHVPRLPDRDSAPEHDTTKAPGTTAVHDVTAVHDTTKVHDKSRVHATTSSPADARLRRVAAWRELRYELEERDDRRSRARDNCGTGRAVEGRATSALAGTPERTDVAADSVSQPVDRSALPGSMPMQASPTWRSSPDDRRGARRWIVVCVAAVLAGLAATGVFWQVLRADGGRPLASPMLSAEAKDRLTAWLLMNTQPKAQIAVPDDYQPQLTRALPGRRVVDLEDSTDADVAVVTSTASPPSHAVPVARISGPGSPIEVLVPLAKGVSPHQAAVRRTRAGQRLVSSLQLRLTPRAWATLSSGKVDVRLTALLAALCRRHTVEVSSFPGDAAGDETGAPARVVAMTAIDGRMPRITGADGGLPALSVLPRGTFAVWTGRDQGQPVVLVRALIPGAT